MYYILPALRKVWTRHPLLLSKYDNCARLTCNVMLSSSLSLGRKGWEETTLYNTVYLSVYNVNTVFLCANNKLMQQLLSLFFSLQKTTITLETAALTAAPPQRVCMWTPLAPPTCPVTTGS